MPFEPGDPKPEKSGRKKGALNKRNQLIADLAAEHDADPALFLIHYMKGDAKALGVEPWVDKDTGKETYPTISLDERRDAAAELMPYLYGKRKPVDANGDDSTDIFSVLLNAVDPNK